MDRVRQRVGIYAFIKNSEEKVLLIRRASHDSMPGTWEIPGGGLEYKESLEEGVLREVREECGIHVTIESILHAHQTSRIKEGIKKQTVRIAYLCRLVDANASITLSKDHDRWEWVDLSAPISLPLSEFLKSIISEHV